MAGIPVPVAAQTQQGLEVAGQRRQTGPEKTNLPDKQESHGCSRLTCYNRWVNLSLNSGDSLLNSRLGSGFAFLEYLPGPSL